MRFGRTLLTLSIVTALAAPAFAAATKTRHTRTSSHASLARRSVKPKLVGQRSIDDARATEIQQALIRAGYLSGLPTGHWDTESTAAMQKVQADNGWQTKLVPDSRALIKLGLGPNSGTASTPGSGDAPVPPRPSF